MSQQNNEEYIDALIARCLAGEDTASDRQSLAEWRAASADNERYYQDAKFLYEASARAGAALDVDTDAAWKKIAGQMKPAAKDNVVKMQAQRRVINHPLLKIAAIIILAIGIPAMIYLGTHRGSNNVQLSATEGILKKDLPDGSQVSLQKGSRLVSVPGKGKNSREYILSGEAAFKVKHDQTNPFIIHTDKIDVQDLGTEFTISALANNDTESVLVLTGSVEVKDTAGHAITLKASETALYIKSKGKLEKLQPAMPPAGPWPVTFENTPLPQVITVLKAKLGADIQLANPGLAKCRITVVLREQPVDEAVNIIAQTLNAKVTAQGGGHYILSGKGCE